ncbi:MAG: hypothetical protein HW402_987 [Dehalococcoidales bacterium]|nr:hypothetical protein [Dehalococcoidales bacterium]
MMKCHSEEHSDVTIWAGEALHPDCFASACGGWSRNDRLSNQMQTEPRGGY